MPLFLGQSFGEVLGDVSAKIFPSVSAVVTQLLATLVLFIIVRFINRLRSYDEGKFFGYEKKEYFKMRKSGMSRDDIEQKAIARDKEIAEKKAVEDAEKKKHSTEGLLEDIKKLLEQKV